MATFKPLGTAEHFEKMARDMTDDPRLQRDLEEFFRAVAYKAEIEQATEVADHTHEFETNFLDLIDTPESYAGEADKSVVVAPDETGLLFAAAAGGGGGIEHYLSVRFPNPDTPFTLTPAMNDYIIPWWRVRFRDDWDWLPTVNTDIEIPGVGVYWVSMHVTAYIKDDPPIDDWFNQKIWSNDPSAWYFQVLGDNATRYHKPGAAVFEDENYFWAHDSGLFKATKPEYLTWQSRIRTYNATLQIDRAQVDIFKLPVTGGHDDLGPPP